MTMNASQVGFNPDYGQDAPTIDQVRALADYAILEFGTPWCGHCKASWPAVEDVLSELKVPHIKVYDGKGKVLGRQFQIKLWPTLILLHAAEEVARLVRPLQVKEVLELVAHTKQ
ncbi:MAG: thioredoxin 1 [Paraglaciecola sp.]|jgi:thioredoxin 1